MHEKNIKFSREKYIGLGHVPVGIGAILKGWNIKEDDFRNPKTLSVVDFRAMTGACPLDCFHCYTNKEAKTMTLKEIKLVIDQIADMGAKAIDYLGEGEPTVDPDFFAIIEYTAKKGIQPIIYTEATKMTDRDFVEMVYQTGASVVPKCDSLFNPEYQNWIIRSKIDGTYYNKRQEALELLIKQGFNQPNEDGTTRLGFDMIVSSRNINEIEKTLRYCRNNNLWIGFSFFLPSGRSGREDFDKSLRVSEEQKQTLRETVQRIDQEYGWNHPIYNNFATMPCVEFIQIYGNGNVSPCPGNETIIGNVRDLTIIELKQKILQKFPYHNPKTFDGNCLYRSRIQP